MSNFLTKVIGRHAASENVIVPVVRGVFEQQRPVLGRSDIPVPWQRNEEGAADNESYEQYPLSKPLIPSEVPDVSRHLTSNKEVKKDSPALSTGQNTEEQARRGPVLHKNFERAAPVLQKKYERATPLHKEPLSTNSMKLTQQRVLDRVHLVTPKDESRAEGLSSKLPGHEDIDANTTKRQAEQVIKPVLRAKHLFEKDAISQLQGREGKSTDYSIQDFPKTNDPFFSNFAVEKDQGGGQPPMPQPSIKVHIGRIEIKAIKEAPARQAKPQAPAQRLSLDEFLKKRDNKLK
jgi:hypothetical protein